jgi:hypothetical protein
MIHGGGCRRILDRIAEFILDFYDVTDLGT